jgi:hypothetical protein
MRRGSDTDRSYAVTHTVVERRPTLAQETGWVLSIDQLDLAADGQLGARGQALTTARVNRLIIDLLPHCRSSTAAGWSYSPRSQSKPDTSDGGYP